MTQKYVFISGLWILILAPYYALKEKTNGFQESAQTKSAFMQSQTHNILRSHPNASRTTHNGNNKNKENLPNSPGK